MKLVLSAQTSPLIEMTRLCKRNESQCPLMDKHTFLKAPDLNTVFNTCFLFLTLFICDITFQCCFALSVRMGIFFCTVLSNDMLALTTTSEYSVPMIDTNIKM